MEIVYAVYHDTNKEARSMEFLLCLCRIGHVHIVTYSKPNNVEGVESYVINKSSPIALINFLQKAKEVVLKVHPQLVVLHDNDCSVLIPYVREKLPECKIVYDSSELFINYYVPGIEVESQKTIFGNDGLAIWLKRKATSFRAKYEKKYLKDVDLIFAANIERARIMKEYFKLKEVPEVFDNMHRIDDVYDEKKCEQDYGSYFSNNKFVILFGGGISKERKTFEYIKAVANSNLDIELIIVGSASPVAQKQYEEMIHQLHSSDRIHYLGFVSRANLRYLMRRCAASVVIFDTYSCNTLYCESGKCYESLFEGTPILASENPPLKRLCVEKKIGVSDNDFARGIMKLRQNYDEYLEGVKKFIEDAGYEKRLNRLTDTIKRVMDE